MLPRDLSDSLSLLSYTIIALVTWLLLYTVSTVGIKNHLRSALLRDTRMKWKTTEEEKEQLKTYPASWWKDPRIFELERRAIFSKEWLFVTQTCRFKKAGDYRTSEIAGFSFIVILGKDETLRAFHNVCRHRAYAVTKKEIGSSTVMGCRYHGWSYDTRGKLVKAPEFDKIAEFRKEDNSLWELKTQVEAGMIFVNFDNANEVAPLDLAKTSKLLNRWNIDNMSPVAKWKIEGKFNWKLSGLLLDTSGKESCPSWHRSMLALVWPARMETLILRTAFACQHSSGVIVFVRVIPRSSIVTVLECSVFMPGSRKTEQAIEAIRSDLDLRLDTLKSIQMRVLNHQEALSEALCAEQEGIGSLLKDHANAEVKAGREIHPAARAQGLTLEGKADDDFCRGLEEERNSVCSNSNRGLLDW